MVATGMPCSRFPDLHTSPDKTLTIPLEVVTTVFHFLSTSPWTWTQGPPDLSESAPYQGSNSDFRSWRPGSSLLGSCFYEKCLKCGLLNLRGTTWGGCAPFSPRPESECWGWGLGTCMFTRWVWAPWRLTHCSVVLTGWITHSRTQTCTNQPSA